MLESRKKAPKKKHTDSKLEWGSSVVSSKLNEALIMHSNEIQFEYSALWDTLSVVWTLRLRLQISCRSSLDNNKSSDYCLRLNVSTHEDDSDSPKKKSELSSINARSIKLSLLFFIVTSAWRMFVCFIFSVSTFVRLFSRAVHPPQKNSSIAFNLLIYSIKCQVSLRWSLKFFFSSITSLTGLLVARAKPQPQPPRPAIMWDMRSDEGEKMMPKTKK